MLHLRNSSLSLTAPSKIVLTRSHNKVCEVQKTFLTGRGQNMLKSLKFWTCAITLVKCRYASCSVSRHGYALWLISNQGRRGTTRSLLSVQNYLSLRVTLIVSLVELSTKLCETLFWDSSSPCWKWILSSATLLRHYVIRCFNIDNWCAKGEGEDLLKILRNFVESPILGVRYGD